MEWSLVTSHWQGRSGSHRHQSKGAEGFKKGCSHFTGGKQKSEACKVCAEADCGTALMGCAVATREMVNNRKSPRTVSYLNSTLTDVT